MNNKEDIPEGQESLSGEPSPAEIISQMVDKLGELLHEHRNTKGNITINYYNSVGQRIDSVTTQNFSSDKWFKPSCYTLAENTQRPAPEPAKESILEYVGRLTPIVKDEYKDCYNEMWNGLLELREVKQIVYDRGKQQDTTFNRNLVAQIIHQIKDKVYVPTANTVQMAECLEPGKGGAHSVRQKLGESPDKVIKKSVEEYFNTHYKG